MNMINNYIVKENITIDANDILDRMEFSRQGKERFKERFIKRTPERPDDEDLNDIYYK